MKHNLWRRILERLAAAHHPTFLQLLDWHEGELEEGSLAWVTRHVLACSKCRKETKRIRLILERSSESLDQQAEPPPVKQGTRRLLRILRDEELLRAAREEIRQGDSPQLPADLRTHFSLNLRCIPPR